MRVVIDDDVDRVQVYWRRRRSRALLIARTFRVPFVRIVFPFPLLVLMSSHSGGRGAEVPPLPIPNREVKLRSAGGTAQAGEQAAAVFMLCLPGI